MELIDIINSLKENASILKKVEILNENKDNDELKQYFFYCLNGNKYGVKKIPEETKTNNTACFTDITNLLDRLAKREITGNKAIDAVSNLLGSFDDSLKSVFINMLQKNPRCNVSVALVNRVWENLVPIEIKLCKANPYSEKNMSSIVYPAFSQRKCDGARCLAMKVNGEVTLYTSGNLEYKNLTSLATEISRISDDDFVLDGEMLVADGDKVASRKNGNGILNKSIHNTISDDEADLVRMVVWDYIPYENYINDSPKMKYREVFDFLHKTIDNTFSRVSVVETKIVNNKEEAFSHFKEMLSRGEEGTILKNMNMKWEGKRSKNCVKFKVVMQTTMKVIDVLEGTEKYTGKLGAIVCVSEEGKVIVKVGSGFTDEERENIWNNRNDMIGHYIEIESNGIIQAEDGTYSLFLPRFVEDRTYEKNVADTFDMIVALSNGSKMLS